MTELECPNCGAKFANDNGWASSALTTLIDAPALPDLASQVRCPNCRFLFAASEVRYEQAALSTFKTRLIWLLWLVLVLWALFKFFGG